MILFPKLAARLSTYLQRKVIDRRPPDFVVAGQGIHRAHDCGWRRELAQGSRRWCLRPAPADARAPHRVACRPVHYVVPDWPKIRVWGFHCADAGWIPWQKFVDNRDSGAIGKGCDQ